MPAGMATAVPKPAMPSIKPPKHQATSSASRRRSLLMEVIMLPITSMAPVRTHRLYVNTAAMITRTMGHRAIKKPSSEAVAICAAGRCHHAKASTHERTNDPIAAFQAGHLKHSSITTSQIIGTRASKNAATSIGRSSLVPRGRHRGVIKLQQNTARLPTNCCRLPNILNNLFKNTNRYHRGYTRAQQ